MMSSDEGIHLVVLPLFCEEGEYNEEVVVCDNCYLRHFEGLAHCD